ncbi:MAG: 2,3-cyclic-nucleotide 2-phosphodiesterase / 3-nucleotidase / 5-nucleotidase [Chloroflexia bacterium]|nr:2,3-cyclic-nucleotide 2-phosphodiesterase / 3-nucleotidase / 5-nucleotidase [Chloroflexia bacterium]
MAAPKSRALGKLYTACVFFLVMMLVLPAFSVRSYAHGDDEQYAGTDTTVEHQAQSQSEGYGIEALQTTTNTTKPLSAKQLIFISDGMRPDLAERWAASGDMPNYARIFGQGVTGQNGMTPQVAANTGAGWTTLSTGAWPGVHGQMNNTYHIDSNGILTGTSGFDGSRNLAETYQEVAEKNGKKVTVIEWSGALPTKIKGPVLDFRNFYSNRGVATNFAIPGARPDPSVNYTNTLQIIDAKGWTGEPKSYSAAKETTFSFNTSVISNTAATITFNLHIYDSTDDRVTNYDKVVLVRDNKDISAAQGELKAGEWKDIKLNLPQNGLLVGFYLKLVDLEPDLSRVRVYWTSLARVRSNLPDLEQTITEEMPSVVASDFAPLQAGLVDAETYFEQGVKFFDAYQRIQEYVLETYQPDVVMAGAPITDEFSHQFLALMDGNYTGPRTPGVNQADAERYMREAYKRTDAYLGRFWELMGPNTITFVGADHGFAATWKTVNANLVLQNAGLYDPNNRAASQAIAYIAGGTANIYINLKDRETGGVVERANYETVRRQIVDAFTNLTDDGAKVAGAVLTKEQARTIKADGITIDAWNPTRTGDVVVMTNPPYQFDAPVAGQVIADAPFYGQHGMMPDLVDIAHNVNMHAMFGIYGPGVAQGRKLNGVRSIDLAPTAAYAMDIPAPRYAEGRVLTEAFTQAPANLVDIQVLAWGDYHGQLDPVQASIDRINVPSGGVANIGAYWKEAMSKNPNGTIVLSDGDNVGATPPNSAFLNDDPTINAMNLLGFTASATGNHEFDKGVAGFQRVSGLAKFSYLADNIIDESTGKLASWAKPYITVQENGIEVGIIGAANPETPLVTSPAGIKGYRWVDPVAPTNQYVKELTAKGIRTIIVVYHQGSTKGDFDSLDGLFGDMAQKLDPEVDLLVGGHTRVKTMTRLNGRLVSAANHALETSEMHLLVDPATKNVVWSWGAFRRPLGGAITPDAGLAALVTQANDAVKPILGEQVGVAAALVDRSRGAESKMGNLVSDAIRATYQVDVALQNSGGLRADFQPGPVSKGDVFAVLPFGNVVVTGDLKGSDLLAALENGVSDVSGSAGRFIQLSGVRFAYDASKPVGQRVLWAVLSNGRPVDTNATYRVATNDFMQVGGDNYTSLTKMTNVVSREQLYEVAANYVKSLGTVNPQVEGRIVALQAGQTAPTPPTAATPALPTPASILPTAVAAGTSVPSTGTVVASPTARVPGMPTTGSNGAMSVIETILAALLVLLVGLLLARWRQHGHSANHL